MMGRQQILGIALAVSWFCLPVMAEPILTLEGLPVTYVPGSSFVFDVRLVGANDLNLYSIDLLMAAQNGSPGIDFRFDESQTAEPASRYVFGDPGLHPDGFWASVNMGGNLATLNLSDLLAVGEMVDTASEVNDLVARVTVATTAEAGDLTFSFDTEFLELQDDAGSNVAGFDNLVTVLPASDRQVAAAIPEPSTLGLIAIGALTLFVCGLRHRRRAR